MTYDTEFDGVIFRVAEDGKVSIEDYMGSTMRPLIERVAPKVREYFESLLGWEIEKEERKVS